MIEQASLVLGNGNWAVKSDSLLGYKTIDGKYYPREMSVVRATTGTRVNEAGLVEVVPYNLLQQSNTFNNVLWQLIGTPTITANYDTNPLTGENDAWRFQSSGTNQIIYQGLNNSFCTFSLYAKGSGIIRIRDGSSTHYTNLTLTSSWQRFLIYIPASFTNVQILSSAGGCDATIYGAQLVEGTEPLDYLPTTDRLDIPRIDYSTGEAALLLEPQRTNLLLQSSSFDNASWIKNDLSVTANSTISPSGVQDADKVQLTLTASTQKYVIQTPSISSGTYTISCFVKADTYGNIAIVSLIGGSIKTSYFNVTNGTLGTTTSGTTSTIEDYGNGWYRVTQTATETVTANRIVGIYFANATLNSINYSGSLTDSFFLWGAQLEAGAYATSYIPTTSASVTRNADVASKTGITSLIGQTEGTIFFDGVINGCQNAFANLINSERNTNTAFSIGYIKASKNLFGQVFDGSSKGLIQGGTFEIGQRFKLAYAYKSGNFALYVNGALIGTSTNTFTFPSTLDDIFIGDNVTFFNFQESLSNNATALWTSRLTNAELAQLTTI